MKSWRIPVAMALLAGSYFGLLCATLYVKSPALHAFFFLVALSIGMVAMSLAQDDGRKR